MKKGEILEGLVTRVDYPDRGIVVTGEGERALVKQTIPGQRVSFRVKKARPEKAEGRLCQILEPSPLEILSPRCDCFSRCGGCSRQTVPVKEQRRIKEEQIRRLLAPYLSEETVFDGILPSPKDWEYRNKMEFSFGNEEPGGPLRIGLHRRGTKYDVLSAKDCALVPGDYRKILSAVQTFCEEEELPFYHKITHEGYLRYLLIRSGHATGEILVCLVTSTQVDCDLSRLRDRLLALDLDGDLVGFVHAKNDDLADNVAAETVDILYGRDYYYEELLGLRFRISLFSFFQTNSGGAEVLYGIVRSYLKEGRSSYPVVYDLYCGTGTIAQIVSPYAGSVYGIELIEEAVDAAKKNAEENGITNCRFLAGDVGQLLSELPERPDFIILDPPREGIVPKSLSKILALNVPQMIYVSCKATSLYRDMEAISKAGYRIRRFAVADLFVHTPHVETVVLMTKA